MEGRECLKYQDRRSVPPELAAFLFSGAAIGGRTKMRHENVRGLRGDFGKKLFDFDVGEDDVGLPLKGFVVAPFETVSFLRRTDEGSGFY